MMEEKTNERRRLWIISELYYPEETSTGYYLTRIAEGLADEFDVKVISGQPNYSARGTKALRHEFRNNVEIFRVSGTTLDKNFIPFRLTNMLTLGTLAFIRELRKFKEGDHVLVVTNPPALPFLTAAAALAKGATYTLLIHDNYPEILIAAGKLQSGSTIAGVLDRGNRWLYKNATRIIVVGRDMLELVGRKADGLDIPIIVIPNWAELERVSPVPRENNKLLRDLGLMQKFVLLYAGNMGPPNDIESIIETADQLRGEPDIHFIFIGAGVKKRFLEQEVLRRSLKNITVLDPRPRDEQIDFLNACDISLVSLVDKMLGVSMPSRTYNILAAGKPIIGIAHEDSELARVVSEERVGWIVGPGSAAGLIKAIMEAKAYSKNELADLGKRSRRAAELKYSLSEAIKSYQAVMR